MNDLIACCGLDCEACDARKATIENDDALRKKVAELWSKLNNVEITPEMINCMGCRADGVKTPFCDSLCEIRKCAYTVGCSTCGECNRLDNCDTVKMIISTNADALKRLKDN